jgi:hypothetical protein
VERSNKGKRPHEYLPSFVPYQTHVTGTKPVELRHYQCYKRMYGAQCTFSPVKL